MRNKNYTKLHGYKNEKVENEEVENEEVENEELENEELSLDDFFNNSDDDFFSEDYVEFDSSVENANIKGFLTGFVTGIVSILCLLTFVKHITSKK